MSSLSSHVLDAATGRPGVGLLLTLYRREDDGSYAAMRSGRTDTDGRVSGWTTEPGIHRLHFETGDWFASHGIDGFYPEVVVAFNIADLDQHYHVPLLLSPFAYSTYRGT